MSNLTDIQIKNLKIEEINSILKSGKYIPITKKQLIMDRKKLLEKKNFNNCLDDFPELTTNTKSISEGNPWKNVSKKVFDKSNITRKEPEPEPELKSTSYLEHNKFEDYESEDSLYHDDDY